MNFTIRILINFEFGLSLKAAASCLPSFFPFRISLLISVSGNSFLIPLLSFFPCQFLHHLSLGINLAPLLGIHTPLIISENTADIFFWAVAKQMSRECLTFSSAHPEHDMRVSERERQEIERLRVKRGRCWRKKLRKRYRGEKERKSRGGNKQRWRNTVWERNTDRARISQVLVCPVCQGYLYWSSRVSITALNRLFMYRDLYLWNNSGAKMMRVNR